MTLLSSDTMFCLSLVTLPGDESLPISPLWSLSTWWSWLNFWVNMLQIGQTLFLLVLSRCIFDKQLFPICRWILLFFLYEILHSAVGQHQILRLLSKNGVITLCLRWSGNYSFGNQEDARYVLDVSYFCYDRIFHNKDIYIWTFLIKLS